MVKIVAVTAILLATLLWRGQASPIQTPASRGETSEILEVSPQKIQIKIEIADSPAERTRGLSGRAELAADTGLLFIFDQPHQPSFWMKEMNFPIDIIWISEDWRIAEITPNLSPATYPQTFSPASPVKYVLEVNAGFAAAHELKVGDQLKYPTLMGGDTSLETK